MFRLALGFVSFFYPLLGDGALAYSVEAACQKPVRTWASPATCSNLPTHQSFGEKESENEFSKRRALRAAGGTNLIPELRFEFSPIHSHAPKFKVLWHNSWSNRAPPSI
ncbi:MAG: hypothetical protein H6617_02515 [Bdellovibrionaceae bacterium]|nr:hypothetical protein [Bdellovibrionales bacterium]MCB9253536.1 hypothetical protein [Pseudobdellovibrionaceae bacterium]